LEVSCPQSLDPQQCSQLADERYQADIRPRQFDICHFRRRVARSECPRSQVALGDGRVGDALHLGHPVEK
jgi:hypothetical protein